MLEHWVSVSIEIIVSIESMCDFQIFLFILANSNIPDSGCNFNLVLEDDIERNLQPHNHQITFPWWARAHEFMINM